MIYEFGKFKVDVDIEATKAFYDRHAKTVLEDCGCINCRNYYEAISKTSDQVQNFFRTLGIDPQKSPEAAWFNTDEKGMAYYWIIFHVVGTIIDSVELYRSRGDRVCEPIHENYYEVDRGFKVGFTSEIVLLEKDFPEPCIQLEIDAHIPWVLG